MKGLQIRSKTKWVEEGEKLTKYFLNLEKCNSRDEHQNLKLLLIDLNQMHMIGLVERTILVFKSSKSDVSLQRYCL